MTPIILTKFHTPYSHYRLDDTSGTVCDDATSNANDCTYYNSPTLGEAGPFAGMKAVSFNGTTQYAERASGTGYSHLAMTYSAWVKTTASNGTICGFWNNANQSNNSYLHVSNGRAAFYFQRAITAQVEGTTAVNDGQWHHVAATQTWVSATSVTVNVYVDGTLEGTTTVLHSSTASMNPTHFAIGRTTQSIVTNYYAGHIANVGVYNRVLSDAEVAAIAASDATPAANYIDWTRPIAAELVGYWGIGASGWGSGTTLTNAAGNVFHLTGPGSGYSWDTLTDGVGYKVTSSGAIASQELPSGLWRGTGHAWTLAVEFIRNNEQNVQGNVNVAGIRKGVWYGDHITFNTGGTWSMGAATYRIDAGVHRNQAVNQNSRSTMVMTYDGSVVRCYYNGSLVSTSASGVTMRTWEASYYPFLGLGIGETGDTKMHMTRQAYAHRQWSDADASAWHGRTDALIISGGGGGGGGGGSMKGVGMMMVGF